MPSAVAEVLDLCENARRVSGGWFDPWAMPAGVDPTGLVKGWAVERALAVLQEAGMEAAMVNGGGDIAVFGAPARGQAWRVGIRHPWRAGALGAILGGPAGRRGAAGPDPGSAARRAPRGQLGAGPALARSVHGPAGQPCRICNHHGS